MAKASVRPRAGLLEVGTGQPKLAHRDGKTRHIVISRARFETVMRAAEQLGLLTKKSSRIAGRVSPALVKQAKRQTGIETDTDLIEFALATVALEDGFAAAFKASRGKVDSDLKLAF